MKSFIAAAFAIAFSLAAPWAVAWALESLVPGLGAASLALTIWGAPLVALNVYFSDWVLDRL